MFELSAEEFSKKYIFDLFLPSFLLCIFYFGMEVSYRLQWENITAYFHKD